MNTSKIQIDAHIKIGKVSLTVADLDSSLTFYQENIGLRLLNRSAQSALLGAGDTPLVQIVHQAGARRVSRTTGLYHFALLLPSRLELARILQHLIDSQTRLSGASDHLVSEALYLNDPDGHGIEIYRDRPRDGWYDPAGNLKMDTHTFEVDSVLAELDSQSKRWDGISPQTVMGHVHLHVSDLAKASDFYVNVLGFGQPPTTFSIPTANFVGAGGYHHHIGLNTWAGVGAPPPPDDAIRLLSYEILFPDEAGLKAIVNRLSQAEFQTVYQDNGWMVKDPSQNTLILRTMA